MKTTVDGGRTPTKRNENKGRTKKIEVEKKVSDQNKFELLVLGDKAFDSCFLWIKRNVQKYKLIDSEKLIVVIRFDETALDWSWSKEERDAFKDWLELKHLFRSVRKKLWLKEAENGWLRRQRKMPEVVWFLWEKKRSTIIWLRRRKKTSASNKLQWSVKVIRNRGESREEEEEVAHVMLPMT
ncbi:transposon Tf2-1 polyprotein isoform X1 [Cucumis melo var. makuwa]|uniref:Transposon Tf2-1 polyprotein isoform X1 n=1 Tax=Cucumis melo var. makuwa TaxID=1194695 RepID=A0A5D3CVB8_CUCMM|nr:transposon Tf2-1 polyprotein isoform X1 [Cucumis melo var. makuwa]